MCSLRETIRDRPAVAASLAGTHAAFARSGTGAVLALDPPGIVPRRWAYRDLSDASSDVQAAAVGTARQDIFVRDDHTRASPAAHDVGGVWEPWIGHGGILTSEPRPAAESVGTCWSLHAAPIWPCG